MGINPCALAQVKLLINDMKAAGLNVNANSISGYRPYADQERVFNNWVQKVGAEEALKYAAKPGYSEHHTGLTFDLKHTDGQLIGNIDPVVSAKEIEYIAKHAARFGFIVRYPKGKESITGYNYEAWHLRYLGTDALKVYESGLTLEEYYNVPGGDYEKGL